ncbi:inorganic diphosphatase [Candidatus Woesearchaeota archaeon]|nr:inorganic diphosphatase [Candidatus Woesearchaeota archaeon]
MKVDRPLGAKHPKWNYVYPINYGFIPGIKAPDGEDLDAYLLGVDQPVHEYTATCIAIAHREDDDDDKLILADKDYADEEIMQAIHFQEKYFKTKIMRQSYTLS